MIRLGRLCSIYSKRCMSTVSNDLKEKVVKLELLTGENKGIAVCTLNKHSTRNAISISIRDQVYIEEFNANFTLLEMCSEMKDDVKSQVLILRSAVPKVFCAGADLKERANMSDDEVAEFVMTLRKISKELIDLPMPTIAALDGAALGGGLEFALACDIRVAATNAKMGLVETTLAIIPGAGGTQTLPRLIGSSNAKDFIFSGRIVDGTKAESIGLVNYVTDQSETGDAAYQYALKLGQKINKSGPIALRMAKLAINKGIELDQDLGMEIEQTCYEQIIPTKDRSEGLKAFQEKRKPVYKGE